MISEGPVNKTGGLTSLLKQVSMRLRREGKKHKRFRLRRHAHGQPLQISRCAGQQIPSKPVAGEDDYPRESSLWSYPAACSVTPIDSS
jgi:hypothetical protein